MNISGLLPDDEALKMSQDHMVKEWHMNKTTVNSYIHKLEEIGLIHIVCVDREAGGYSRGFSKTKAVVRKSNVHNGHT